MLSTVVKSCDNRFSARTRLQSRDLAICYAHVFDRDTSMARIADLNTFTIVADILAIRRTMCAMYIAAPNS